MWCIAELNEEYIARMEDVLKIYEKPLSEREPVVCVDEKPVVLHADVRPPRPRQEPRCAPTAAPPRRGRCGRDGLPGVIRSTSGAGRPTSSAVSSPRPGGTLPNQLRTAPRRSSPITWWRS